MEPAFDANAVDAATTRIRIVLVGTQHPGNIGSAARALKTMGLRRLTLVAPQRFPHADAEAMAAGADDVLAQAQRFDTLADAIADCRLVLGCSARSRRIALEQWTPREAASRALAVAAQPAEVAIVFGRERTGLDNEELQLCHAAVHIPSNPEYSSLNLAAAVQVLSYELRVAGLAAGAAAAQDGGHGAGKHAAQPVAHAELEGFFAQLAETLEAIEFHKGRAPESAMRKLRRLFLRAGLNQREVRLLRGILADAQRMARIAGEYRP